ncbi:substrate-binding domain-containing protein [Paenibacillus sp. NEAU-GSW1]|uniref:substrate-binding domain-containing protein n=1 Tax=Paenibacillus sp. NEAU-GSW1 TaxID=2682486 RepID=UPI0012E290B5|nr:substrate-binding domain-containing protein [Paenibacillus sp. NEAU-GSW1]MUT68764.1 substrate-binding domain-containing protein [Paenibacillus sp. NEAU-GSW1]
MRKLFILLLSAGCIVLSAFTLSSLIKVFNFDLSAPAVLEEGQDSAYRVVLITQEMDTPFWDQVEKGASEAAARHGVELAVWGSYGTTNQVDFLRKMEIAIASKVDGIIVQGLDTDVFNKLSTVKAAGNGIPIFTIANDVPIEKSLRRTYIGSDHEKAGRLIGEQLASDIGVKGKVVLMLSDREEDYQNKRLNGILSALQSQPGIETILVKAGDTREEVMAATTQIMNSEPQIDGFVSITANNTSAMVQEIAKRSKLSRFHLYSFDDSVESRTLMKEHKLNGIIEQQPEEMGKVSVDLMVQWLSGNMFPLNYEGYFTEISLLKADGR